ncbi:MAG: Gfo/Idh/MocA family oxidoreductase [Acidobacteriota bacterium]
MKTRRITRRDFLKNAASTTASALIAPWISASRALGGPAIPPPSDRVTLGHIGVGGQGTWLLNGFLEAAGCQSIAVCDPFRNRREEAAELISQKYASLSGKAEYRGCAAYEDFRELLARSDIDAVVIATPDHWHVPIAIATARAGKDMYVEKPLGLSINENKALRAAVERHGRIFQYGTQQRCFNPHCAFACELVRNGYLGRIREIQVEAPAGTSGGSTEPAPVPEGFNYDLWLGPAPESPYTLDRCTNLGSYHVYDNSIGFIAGWGAHPLDIMHWGFPQIPVEYEGTGTVPLEGLFNTITNWNVRGRFADGVLFTFRDGPDKTTFIGEEGWVAASRAGIDAEPKSLLQLVIKPGEIRLLQNGNHYQNFVDCVKSRRQPASPIQSAVQSDFISHLSDIAIRTGRKILWDPVAEEIIGDETATRFLSRPLRSPWRL